jgi:hypothetical protein
MRQLRSCAKALLVEAVARCLPLLVRSHRPSTETRVKGDADVLKHLNEVLTNELTAIDQYFLHAKMFEHWGFNRLAKREREASIDEMKHAEGLMERILFLEGFPICRICTSF